ncbi:MAG: hypothetical protein AB7V27_19810 [Candidatus Binatia bacterium]
MRRTRFTRWASRIALGVSVCLGAPITPAADTAASGLSDGEIKAQCLRLRELCETAEKRDSELGAATRNVEADATVENIDRYRDAFMGSELALRQLHRAAAASVKAQGHVPRCVHQCPLLRRYLERVREQRHLPKS